MLKYGDALLKIAAVIGIILLSVVMALHETRAKTLNADFSLFFSAAQNVENGKPLYRVGDDYTRYVYTPFLALLLKPLTYLGFHRASQVWRTINVLSILTAAAVYLAAVRARRQCFIEYFALTTVVGLTNVCAHGTLHFGMVNGELLLIVACLYKLDLDRSYWAMAVLIALAGLIKTWPIGLILLLLVRGAYRQAVLSILLFMAAAFLCFVLIGTGQFRDFLNCNEHFSLQPVLLAHSVPGFALTHFKSGVNAIDSPLLRWGFVTTGYAAFVCVMAHIWSRRNIADNPERLLHVALIVSILVLSLPVSHVEYILLSIPLIWTLLLSPHLQLARTERVMTCLLGFALYFLLVRAGPYYETSGGAAYKGISAYYVSVPFFIHITAAATAYALMLNEIARRNRQTAS